LISNNDALILLEEVRSASCSGTGDLEIGFVAQDSCNNLSTDTLFAIFSITDNIPPEFIMSSKDVSYNCHYGIKDSLQYWIDKIGFAEIEDNCSDTIIRTNYSWKDNLGNTGFSDFEGPTNIVISREVCLWSVDVSFFIEDECGNINVSSATFRINGDSHSPDIVNAPRDTIIQCSENIPDSHIIFMDGCDGDLEFEFTETNTRATDELECAYYNYDITRHWNARDACGNEEVFTQFISVRDTSGPEAIYQGVLALDCDSDITDLSDFINITDNCRMDTIFYSDSIISSSRCNTEILRNYIARDICQNETGFEQTLQLQDFSAPGFMTLPKDTIVECSEDVINIFNTWIDSFGFAIVNDNCNQFYTKALNPGLYTDTILINNSITPGYSIPECSQQAEDGILGFQIVEFVVYDECGNINMNRASFTVVDTVAPDIQFCPADLDIDLFDTQCDTSLLIRLPGIDDNCFPGKTDNYQVQINSDTPIIPLQDSIFLNFPAGRNKVQYHYRDCGGNTDSCTQIIQINDLEAPILTCPDDITIILEEQNCNAEYILSSLQDFFENCASPVDFSVVKPEAEGLLSFYLNNSTGKYSARNSILTFSEIQSEGLIGDVRLILEYSMNLSPGSQVELRSESGNLLHQISTSNCNEEEVIIKIAQDQFDFWSNDGRINFAIVHLTGSGEGTIPCASENLSGQVTNDGVSYFRISVEYSDIKPEVTIKYLGTDELIPLGQDVVSLEPGSYIAEYSEEDAFGNTGMCFQKIEVIDEKIPQITCKDVVIETPVQASPFYNLITANHIQSVSDNCAIETVELSEDRFSCSEIGTSFEIQLEATDIYGNSSTCNSIVTAKSVPLNPNYLSSLCLADSLQLFANLDPAFVQSYIWTGPDNFRSQEADPIIQNINNSNSGTYFLTVTTRNGCTFFGSLDITIDEFYNPVIASDTTDYCLNEDVFLSASIFTEQVNYLWYEGIPPAGNLVNETTDPVLVLNPSPGKHFYYVEIMSEICNSNPSPVIAIDVLPQPVAEVDQVFITICEGEDIILSTSIFSSILNYEWTGPNGYFSRDRLPAVIEDTDLSDGGVYTLTIDNGICSSDPAYTQVTIFEQPPRPEITSNGVFCEGQNAVLDVLNTPTGIRYHWFKNGQLFSSTSSNSLLLNEVSAIDTGAYSV
ncbi:MAG: hypothetical protein KJO50_10030, partial [Bacteroidia bacterium]|nr:hypothetical protein [Bacteroidia bacterium]